MICMQGVEHPVMIVEELHPEAPCIWSNDRWVEICINLFHTSTFKSASTPALIMKRRKQCKTMVAYLSMHIYVPSNDNFMKKNALERWYGWLPENSFLPFADSELECHSHWLGGRPQWSGGAPHPGQTWLVSLLDPSGPPLGLHWWTPWSSLELAQAISQSIRDSI
jgi:hypothetical protein